MLTSLCRRIYGMEPLDLTNIESLDQLQIGAVVARKAMRELPSWLRSTVGMMHFGGIVEILPTKTKTKTKKTENEENEKNENIYKRLANIIVVHFVKNHKTHSCYVNQTNMLHFLFGSNQPPMKSFLEHFDEVKSVFALLNTDDEEKRTQIAESMKATLGCKRYRLFSENCEHWMTRVVYGAPSSIQIEAGVATAAVAAGALGLLVYQKRNRNKNAKAKG